MQVAPHRQPLIFHPLAQLAAAFAVGIVATHFLSPPLASLLIPCALTSVLAMTCLLKDRMSLSTLFVTLAFLFAGSSLASVESNSASADRLKRLLDNKDVRSGAPVELTGVLKRPPEFAPASVFLTLEVSHLRSKGIERTASGTVVLRVPIQDREIKEEYHLLDLRYGARIRVMTVLKRSDYYRNPGVSSFTEYLEREGFDATGFVKSSLLIERLDDERVFLPLVWLYDCRQRLEDRINSHFSLQTAGVLIAAFLGNRYYLSRSTAERFRDGGTFHVLVISGLHITFIGGLVLVIARRIFKRRGLQVLLATIVLWSYTLAVGAEVSVIRAALMFTLIASAPVVARRAAPLNALGGAALILLMLRPHDLFDPSLQLTFLSVLAIVACAWPLLQKLSAIGSWRLTRDTPYPPSCAPVLRSFCESLYWSERAWQEEIGELNHTYGLFKTPLAGTLERYRLQRALRYAFAAIVVSLSVQITLLPLLIVYFHRLSLASVVLNIGVNLVMAMLAVVAVITLVMAPISASLTTALSSVAAGLNWLMVHSVDPFAGLGIASMRLPHYAGKAGIIYVLYYLPLALLWLLLARWNPLGAPTRPSKRHKDFRVGLVALAQLFALLVVVFHPLSAARSDGKLHVDFLDVGQADAALVTMPDGTTILVDGGGRPSFQNTGDVETEEGSFERDTRSVGESVVSEYLWWRGLDRVDFIISTHADSDHIDGLNAVASNFRVRGALVGRTPSGDPEFTKFQATLVSKQIPIHVIGAGDVFNFGGANISVLWPRSTVDPDAPSRNNDSVVLKVRFGQRTILLTGDIESAGEEAMLNGVDGKLNLRADVVKVAHHGSRTSSTAAFVTATQPDYAVISVGQNSIFGHPHKEVVERWRAEGAKILITGQSGMITVTTDGEKLDVTTFQDR